jgi:integrase/recombinase XerC/integrase/recombinase XerD
MNILSAYELFKADRAVYCSPETLNSYGSHLNIFFKFIQDKYVAFDDVPGGVNIYSDYIVYLRGKGTLKNVSIRSYCRAVKVFLKFCFEKGYCRDFTSGVKLPKDDSEPKLPLFTDEVKAIDSTFNRLSLKGKRNYAIVHLMLDCGLRSQEVRHIKMKDLDRKRNLIHIVDSKGNKSRIVLCPDFVFDAIDLYNASSSSSTDFVFRSLKADVPLKKNTLNLLFADLKVECGVERLHPHLLRHTFATSYLLGGGNLEFLRVFLGHTDYNVTKVYSSLAAQCKMLGADVYKLDKIFFERGY